MASLQWIGTHCYLYFEEFQADRYEIVERTISSGVGKCYYAGYNSARMGMTNVVRINSIGMGRKIFIIIICSFPGYFIYGQDSTSSAAPVKEKKWEFNATANLYFLKDDFFVLPIATADRGRLHLEARYNYEDRNTTSLWAGMNFNTGKEFTLDATIMAGVIFGNTDGVAPGVELTMAYKRFEWYTEGEFYINTKDINQNYFYFWTDLTYAPTEWLNFGISGQRTRLYQTSVDIQRGIQASFNFKNATLTGYWYNIGKGSSSFVILGLGYSF